MYIWAPKFPTCQNGMKTSRNFHETSGSFRNLQKRGMGSAIKSFYAGKCYRSISCWFRVVWTCFFFVGTLFKTKSWFQMDATYSSIQEWWTTTARYFFSAYILPYENDAHCFGTITADLYRLNSRGKEEIDWLFCSKKVKSHLSKFRHLKGSFLNQQL